MSGLREWLVRFWSTLRPRRSDRDLEEELRAHADMAGEAGGVAQAMEAVRDQRGLSWLRDLGRDLRYGVRGCLRDPAFTAVAVVSLAVGIGANTAIFSLADAVLLRSLPVDRPQDLVFLQAVGTDGGGGAPPYPCFEHFRRETTAFSGMAAFTTDHLRVQVDGGVEQVMGQVASDNYFELLGVTPAAGRLFAPGDERLDPPVAVIGYGYWQRRFGGDAAAIGKTITFRNRAHTIVGVMPPKFWGLRPGEQVDVTLPITIEGQELANAGSWWFETVARLRPGISAPQATSQVDAIFQTFMKDRNVSGMRAKYFDHMQLTPAARGLDMLRARFSKPLYGLTVVAGLVLMIACANLGSLLLVRGAVRAREFAVRLATGAGRSRLLRQLLTETGVLFFAGAAAGLVVARVAIGGLTGFFAIGRSPILVDVAMNWRSAAFAAGLAGLGAVATGLWPAVRALRTDPHIALKDGSSRLTGTRRLNAATRVLVVAQVAMAFVLVVAAVVFARTMVNLRGVEMGFARAHVTTVSLDPLLPAGAPANARPQFWAEVLNRIRARPGVRSASLSTLTPLSGRDTNHGITVPGFQPREGPDRFVHVNHVSEGYFETFDIRRMSGRVFAASDAASAPRVVVINEAAAAAFFPGRNAVGQIVTFGTDAREVVGVVRDYKHMSIRAPAPRFAFIPISQPLNGPTRITLAVSSDEPSSTLTRAITQEVQAAHAATLVSDVMRVEDQIDATLLSERLLSTLALAFAVVALGLAALGVYGVLSYSVTQRRPEFGLRLALGASATRIARGVLQQVLREVAIGMAIGLPLALSAARLADGLLFGVSPSDPGTYLLGGSLLAIIACVAAMLPARRACAIDPAETLRA